VRQVRLLTMFAVVIAAVVFGCRGCRPQATPGAPSNLSYVVSPGGGVSLQWTHGTGISPTTSSKRASPRATRSCACRS
jgi:hypothetical protein